MNFYTDYFPLIINAIGLYGTELAGAFLMASLINLIHVKGTQKESFNYLSTGFYTLILRDILLVCCMFLPTLQPTLVLPDQLPLWIGIGCCSLAAALFVVGALKNLQLYFSAPLLTVLMTLIIGGIGATSILWQPATALAPYLQNIALTASFFTVGLSFYFRRNNGQTTNTESMGVGFIVLGFCYLYLAADLLTSPDVTILLCYTIALMLSLAAQIQFLNHYVLKLETNLAQEKINREKIWDISPFPILISRLRDDAVLYMNPAARQTLFVKKGEVFAYPFAAYFAEPKKRTELSTLIKQEKVVHSFETEVHHPNLDNYLWVDLSTRAIDLDEEVALYTTFKDITERKKMTQILQEQASTDPLTGLYNRRQFEILVHQALHTAERYGTPYSMAMIDIDFFKKVNDTYGHDAGDAVLKKLADTLKATLRKSDIIARFGGEEFVLFFSQTPPSNARTAAEHVRHAVENMNVVVDEQSIPVTVSLGISSGRTADLSALIKQADEALYHSKQNGRNQVTLYDDLHPETASTPDNIIELNDPIVMESDTVAQPDNGANV